MQVGLASALMMVDYWVNPAPFEAGVEDRRHGRRYRLIFSRLEFVSSGKQHFTMVDRDVLAIRVHFNWQNNEVVLKTGGRRTIQDPAGSEIASNDRWLLVAEPWAIAPGRCGR